MKSITAAKFLKETKLSFSEHIIALSSAVHHGIRNTDWSELSTLLNRLSLEEREELHYAFFDQFGYDYELKIRRLVGNYQLLREYGLAFTPRANNTE